MRAILHSPRAILLALLLLAGCSSLLASDEPQIMPLDQVKPGMKGVAYTIFAGDKIEPMELEVIGVLPNTLGPKQDVILVVLKGTKPEYTGVVAGMSGSPVYIDGKLVGAISLRFGQFSKDALAGVTPIQSILDAEQTAAPNQRAEAGAMQGQPASQDTTSVAQYPLPAEMAQRVGVSTDGYLTQIETPLVFSGFTQAALQRFGDQLAGLGLMAAQGGTAKPQSDDGALRGGDMVSMVLVKGDLTLSAACTVTAVIGDRVFVCGHPLFGYGDVELPMARGRVVTTLASSFNSFKIVNAGGVIGSINQDRTTAVIGRLGPAPRMIPVDLSFASPAKEKQFHFEVMEHPKMTPLLVAIATFNGLVGNPAYSEGMTFQLKGSIELEGHTKVTLENMYAPTDQAIPDGLFVALAVQNVFTRIFTNPYERACVERVSLRVESIPERRWATIESAWSEKSEVTPGEKLDVKVLLRPYRGTPFMREVPITIPQQAAKGPLRIVVSDSDVINRMTRFFAGGPQSRLQGLEQLITLINKERRNDRLYVSLVQPTPTLLVEEKELPNAPLSQINVLDQRRMPGSSMLLRESTAGEWSLPLNQVITGQYILTVTVK